MSSLIKESTQFRLTPERLDAVLQSITENLLGRVQSLYVFGSAALGTISEDSDIDLILVVNSAKTPFVQRAFEFADLFEVYPKLDLLVYTQEELDRELADSSVGFWKSVRLSMKKLI